MRAVYVRAVAQVCFFLCVLVLVYSLIRISPYLVIISAAIGLMSFLVGLLGTRLEKAQHPASRPGNILGKFGLALGIIGCFPTAPALSLIRQTQINRDLDDKYRAIGYALLQFAENNDEHRLPPHALASKTGQPLLSWRVLILPYLGEKELYGQFKLDEAWDSPHNIKLLPMMPSVFSPPTYSGIESPPHGTFCQVLVGHGTALYSSRGNSITSDFPSGISGTVLVVEGSKTVPWTKPEDIAYIRNQPIPELGKRASSNWPFILNIDGTFRVVWGDGSVEQIPCDNWSSADSQALGLGTTRDGGSPRWRYQR